jgi:hypothetical protein
MPLSLSDARAIVLDPAAALAAPAVTAHAFALLAEARGGCIARPHLLRPAHLSDAPRRVVALPATTTTSTETVATIDAIRARVAARVRSMIAAAPAPAGGDAA